MQWRSIYRVGQAQNKWHQKPNWFIIYFLCNIFKFAGIFILKLKNYTVFENVENGQRFVMTHQME